MNDAGRIAVCGEILIDLVGQGGSVFHAHAGGSPANVATGLARLEVPSLMLARLADGPFGDQLRRHLAAAGVDLSGCVRAREPATLAVVSYPEPGVPRYDFWTDGTADWQWAPGELPGSLPGDVTALHTGSLALAVEPGASVLTGWLGRIRESGRVTISFDPNIRPFLDTDREAARLRVESQIRLADLVKVSAEDLAWIAPDEPPAELASRWCRLGPSLVVVTLGAEGAFAVTRAGQRVERPTVPVTVQDTVGAGDAFAAGLLAGMYRAGLLGGPVPEVPVPVLAGLLDQAGAASALACTRAGASPPTRAELREFRSRHDITTEEACEL